MKAIRWLILGMMVTGCVTVPLLAATVKLVWGRSSTETWDKVRLYRKTGTTYTLVAEVDGATTNWTGAVPAGVVTFIARSVVGTLESEDSNPVTAELRPDPPVNLMKQ